VPLKCLKISYSNLLPNEIPYGVPLGMTTQLSIEFHGHVDYRYVGTHKMIGHPYLKEFQRYSSVRNTSNTCAVAEQSCSAFFHDYFSSLEYINTFWRVIFYTFRSWYKIGGTLRKISPSLCRMRRYTNWNMFLNRETHCSEACSVLRKRRYGVSNKGQK
jgi:hypothetical protein